MIFVLGGEGFIGSAICRYYRQHGIIHTCITRENYQDYLGRSCDMLVNANGNSRKYIAQRDPLWEFDASVRSVCASLSDFKYGCYVYLSSCDVYSDCSSPEITHEETEIVIEQQSAYGFHKYLAEQIVRHSTRNWLILRLGGFVGLGLKKNPIYDILQGGPLWLAPESELQFLQVEEVAHILQQLIQLGHKNDTFNLCGKGLVCLKDVIEWTQFPVLVNPCSSRVRYDVSIQKLSAILSIPETRPSVEQFIREEMQRRYQPE